MIPSLLSYVLLALLSTSALAIPQVGPSCDAAQAGQIHCHSPTQFFICPVSGPSVLQPVAAGMQCLKNHIVAADPPPPPKPTVSAVAPKVSVVPTQAPSPSPDQGCTYCQTWKCWQDCMCKTGTIKCLG